MLKHLLRPLIVPFTILTLVAMPITGIFSQPQFAIAATSPSQNPTQITFSYDSPNSPWTAAELASLQSWISQVSPVITDIMGHPSHSFTINIAKDPSISYAGLYFSGTNQLILHNFDQAVVAHELIHAFRDDNILGLSTWEEGMTRAVEIETMTRLSVSNYFDLAHGYPYDVYYDNTVGKSGVASGSIFGMGDSTLALTRYQIAGYAWGKVLIENPGFLRNFNAALYANPSISSDESALIATAASYQPTVEGQSFRSWYAAQGIFNTNPSPGCVVFQRISQFTIDFFCRDASGIETPQPGATINWSATGANGQILSSGQTVTTSRGWANIIPTVPTGYSGRIGITASAASAAGTASDTSYRALVPETGVFGVTTGPTTGTVAFTSPSNAFTPFSVPVTNGAFSAPALQSVRGTINATFTDSTASATRTFTKDASAYSLVLKPIAIPAPTVTITAGNNQSAKIYTTFATRMGVRVVDAAGKPVIGASVIFTAPSSGATGRFSGSSKVTVKTDSTGLAKALSFKANGTAGSYSVKATYSGKSVSFALKNFR